MLANAKENNKLMKGFYEMGGGGGVVVDGSTSFWH